ncbi:ComF family protein [Paludibacteraceae bacterium OttesenSCG-928-F17]|nr:ComF family protein [Paludibacteraceae bacterium OttesenSCG-928-F17]
MKQNPLADLLNLMYPPVCLACGKNLLGTEEHLCLSCLHHIPKTNYHLQKDNPVEERFWGKVPVFRASSFFLFNKGSSFQKILHNLKYQGAKELGSYFGKCAGIDLLQSPDFSSVDYIIPVPLHPDKLKKRGYNQSEWIAGGLAESMNKPVDTAHLIRTQANVSQTNKNVYERYENTAGIFELTDNTIFSGKHVLVVDDVLTTGSTLEACVQALLPTENIRISLFTLALA